MSLSVDLIRERWSATKGKDPLFAAIDGSDNPSAPQDRDSSHSLLLNRGLFRVGLPWPPAQNKSPEFSIEVVRDPTGVNRDQVWTEQIKRAMAPLRRVSRVMPSDAPLYRSVAGNNSANTAASGPMYAN